MPFTLGGDYQLVMQIYWYKKHRIICNTKVQPCTVSRIVQKQTDYHWMTPSRWSNIETGLYGLLEQEQDIQNLHADLLIDHIKVRVDSIDSRRLSTEIRLPGVSFSKSDLCLIMQLEYIETVSNNVSTDSNSSDHEVHAQKTRKDKPTKRTHSNDQQVAPAPEKRKNKKVSVDSEKQKPTKQEHRSQSIESAEAPAARKEPVKVCNARRSLSQDYAKGKTPNSGRSSLEKKATKRVPTPDTEKSIPSADGPSPTRRPRRPLTRPSHLDDFIIGGKKKTDKKDHTDGPMGKKANANGIASSPSKAIKKEELNEPPPSKPKSFQLAGPIEPRPAPRKVKILLMDKMEKEEILNTFSKYESDLTTFFKANRHKHIDRFMDIQHVHVIDIVRRDVELCMIRKLGQVYGTRTVSENN
ncbi:blast:Endoplasmin [Drosophila guanche]|uniref:Blast:Endoplasmin n=1 Tax=Drosophila guanche TaxID=7266 RepID=A0A3B0KCM5_DROGU|nr:blast:Endoplasmin [Drosophila guanche]